MKLRRKAFYFAIKPIFFMVIPSFRCFLTRMPGRHCTYYRKQDARSQTNGPKMQKKNEKDKTAAAAGRELRNGIVLFDAVLLPKNGAKKQNR